MGAGFRGFGGPMYTVWKSETPFLGREEGGEAEGTGAGELGAKGEESNINTDIRNLKVVLPTIDLDRWELIYSRIGLDSRQAF